MNPLKVDRAKVGKLADLPNIGPATVADLKLLGIRHPAQLIGQCPFSLYQRLCHATGGHHDPCVIDVFMSAIRFMAGEAPRPWWEFTALRKKHLLHQTD